VLSLGLAGWGDGTFITSVDAAVKVSGRQSGDRIVASSGTVQ
jgi:hypothetical protein